MIPRLFIAGRFLDYQILTFDGQRAAVAHIGDPDFIGELVDVSDDRIKVLSTLEDVDRFTEEYGDEPPVRNNYNAGAIRWETVADAGLRAVIIHPHMPRIYYRYRWVHFNQQYGPVCCGLYLGGSGTIVPVLRDEVPLFIPMEGRFDPLPTDRPMSWMETLRADVENKSMRASLAALLEDRQDYRRE